MNHYSIYLISIDNIDYYLRNKHTLKILLLPVFGHRDKAN